MNLTISPFFYNKNEFKKNNQAQRIALADECDVFISFAKKSKHSVQSPRQIALQDALYGHNIMVYPETLGYIFNTKYHQETRFKEYRNLGSLALEAYKRMVLAQKFPCTSWH